VIEVKEAQNAEPFRGHVLINSDGLERSVFVRHPLNPQFAPVPSSSTAATSESKYKEKVRDIAAGSESTKKACAEVNRKITNLASNHTSPFLNWLYHHIEHQGNTQMEGGDSMYERETKAGDVKSWPSKKLTNGVNITPVPVGPGGVTQGTCMVMNGN
jgi:hypothetical protein